MKRFLMTAVTAAAIFTAAPAFAQMAGQKMEAGDMPTTCQGMMDKASPMMDSMSDGNKKMMAMKQMDMAKTSMASGKEKNCMMHMHKAMGMM